MFGSRFAGLVDVIVDGVTKITDFDCYLYIDGSTNSMKNVPMIRLFGLDNEKHKIEIVCKGTSGAKSNGTTVGVNFIYFMDTNTVIGKVDGATNSLNGCSTALRQAIVC